MNAHENSIIVQALAILDGRIKESLFTVSAPQDVKNYLRLRMELLEHEVFAALMLDNRHRVIEFKILFRGTINAASVYPREVVKEALAVNAAAVVFSHNHPSGDSEPSMADRKITERLVNALQLVDVRVLDYIVVGHGEMVSFAERGFI